MANGIRTGDSRGFNKGRSSKFRVGSRVLQTPEEGRRTYRPKRWGNNNKDEDNSPKTLNDKHHRLRNLDRKKLTLNFPDFQMFLNLPHKVYNHKMYIGDSALHRKYQYLHFDLKIKMSTYDNMKYSLGLKPYEKNNLFL